MVLSSQMYGSQRYRKKRSGYSFSAKAGIFASTKKGPWGLVVGILGLVGITKKRPSKAFFLWGFFGASFANRCRGFALMSSLPKCLRETSGSEGFARSEKSPKQANNNCFWKVTIFPGITYVFSHCELQKTEHGSWSLGT